MCAALTSCSTSCRAPSYSNTLKVTDNLPPSRLLPVFSATTPCLKYFWLFLLKTIVHFFQTGAWISTSAPYENVKKGVYLISRGRKHCLRRKQLLINRLIHSCGVTPHPRARTGYGHSIIAFSRPETIFKRLSVQKYVGHGTLISFSGIICVRNQQNWQTRKN